MLGEETHTNNSGPQVSDPSPQQLVKSQGFGRDRSLGPSPLDALTLRISGVRDMGGSGGAARENNLFLVAHITFNHAEGVRNASS